jgi:site-specific recombinase XerD
VLRLLFAHLVDRGVLSTSPARLLKNGRIDRPLPVALTEAETRRLTRALDAAAEDSALGRRDRLLFTLLLRSGMRLSAALALDVADLDLASGTATSRGKHGRVQGVFLPRDLIQLFRSYLKGEAIKSGALFRSARGSRLSARQAQYRFCAALDLAGIDRPVTVHSLRHTFATRLRERTGDLRIVQAALGHRHLATTEVYAHVDAAEVRKAVAG